jgi:hypothetical protein
MDGRRIGTLGAIAALCGLAGGAAAQVSIGASFDKEGLTGFYLGVGEYYKVPEREVVVVRERGIPDEDLPVVFLIAARAKVAPEAVLKLRLRGISWGDITLHFGLSPAIFYVPVQQTPGPPYGKAYGYYKKTPKSQWKTIKLSDAEVVNLVNLKFISEHYGYSPDEVIRMRASGKKFVEINREVKAKKQGKAGPAKAKGPGPEKKTGPAGAGKGKKL